MFNILDCLNMQLISDDTLTEVLNFIKTKKSEKMRIINSQFNEILTKILRSKPMIEAIGIFLTFKEANMDLCIIDMGPTKTRNNINLNKFYSFIRNFRYYSEDLEIDYIFDSSLNPILSQKYFNILKKLGPNIRFKISILVSNPLFVFTESNLIDIFLTIALKVSFFDLELNTPSFKLLLKNSIHIINFLHTKLVTKRIFNLKIYNCDFEFNQDLIILIEQLKHVSFFEIILNYSLSSLKLSLLFITKVMVTFRLSHYK